MYIKVPFFFVFVFLFFKYFFLFLVVFPPFQVCMMKLVIKAKDERSTSLDRDSTGKAWRET